MTSGNWKPLFFALTALFLVGGLLNLIVGSFVDLSNTQPPNGFMGNIYHFVHDGFNITISLPVVGDVSFPFNIFAVGIGGEFVKDFVSQQILILSFVPDLILIPGMILFIIAIIYSIVKLFLP